MTYLINDNGVQREMSAKEIELYEIASAEILAEQKKAKIEAQAKTNAKNAVLAKLGLTADEVAALLS